MNQIKAGATLNYIIIFLNTVLGLCYTPYMIHMLGQNEYGLYSLVSSIIAYLTIFDFGFGNAIVRYTSKYIAEGKLRQQWELFGTFLLVYSVIGFIALCIGVALYFNIDGLFGNTMNAGDIQQAKIMMLMLIINLALTFPFSMFGSIITAHEDFVFQKIATIARIILSTVTIIALLHFGYKAVAMVVVQTVFNLSVLFINFLYCKFKLRIKLIFGKFDWNLIKEITIYSFWLFLNAIMDRIYWGTGQFVLGALIGTTAVAVFSVAILLQSMYMSFSTSISNVLLPRVTTMVTNNHSAQTISDLFIRTGRIQCIIMTYVLCGFIVFGQIFINFWAGPDYKNSYPITLIFFITLFIPLIQNTGITILQARNQMKFRSILYCVISVVSLLLQICLAQTYGVLGCAWAIGGALIVGQGIIMNIYYARWQKLNIILFWREIGKMLLPPAGLTVISVLTTSHIQIDNIGNLFIGIIIFSAIYIPVFWRFSMNRYERNLVLEPIRKLYLTRFR